MDVGLIGLGGMGTGMAKSLLRAGHRSDGVQPHPSAGRSVARRRSNGCRLGR